MKNKKKYQGVYNRFFKRLLDAFISTFLIILLCPFILIFSIVILIDSGVPVFYKADRGGYKEKTFKILKFRTMVKNADKIGGGTTALNDPRITKVGNFFRKTKIDEIPQLFNIFVGQMSFIGPRPELIQYTSNYDENEKIIFQVRPGLTDYSSLEFINLDEMVGSLDADNYYEQHVLKKKNELRIKYAENVSFLTDISLFFKTIVAVIKKALKFIFMRKKST